PPLEDAPRPVVVALAIAGRVRDEPFGADISVGVVDGDPHFVGGYALERRAAIVAGPSRRARRRVDREGLAGGVAETERACPAWQRRGRRDRGGTPAAGRRGTGAGPGLADARGCALAAAEGGDDRLL